MKTSKLIRYLCSELVYITSLSGPRRTRQLGNLEEIGRSFAEILTEQALPRKSNVRITCEDYQMDGVVESCSWHRPLGYFVRVKVARSSWSERWFKPEHMLRIRSTEPKVSPLRVASGY